MCSTNNAVESTCPGNEFDSVQDHACVLYHLSVLPTAVKRLANQIKSVLLQNRCRLPYCELFGLHSVVSLNPLWKVSGIRSRQLRLVTASCVPGRKQCLFYGFRRTKQSNSASGSAYRLHGIRMFWRLSGVPSICRSGCLRFVSYGAHFDKFRY